MSVYLSERQSCNGCLALERNQSTKEWYCRLGFTVNSTIIRGEPLRPTPVSKCYSPTTPEKLVEAVGLIQRKIERSIERDNKSSVKTKRINKDLLVDALRREGMDEDTITQILAYSMR